MSKEEGEQLELGEEPGPQSEKAEPKAAPREVAADPERQDQLRRLASRLGFALQSLPSLDRALTHASAACEAEGPVDDYESLEFLGDAALGLAIADGLFQRLPDRTPGEYSRLRAGLVNRRSLARLAQELNIAPAIRLGRGEELSGGRQRTALLADCLEAIIGAIYIDQGWRAVRRFVERVFGGEMDRAGVADKVWDYKSRLQHHCQAQHMALPNFVVVTSRGPDHHKEFEVEVFLQGKPAGRGRGMSKKEAEQNAAKAALECEGGFASEDEASAES